MIGVLVLQPILILMNAIFACAEIAIISINDTKIQKMADNGNKRAKILRKFSSQPAKVLSTIQVAITLAGFLGSAFAADTFSEPLVSLILKTGIKWSPSIIKTICVVLITFILAYFNIVFGELIPKRLAMKNPEKIALLFANLLRIVSLLFAPLVWILTISTNGILKIFGISPNEEVEKVTEDDIIMMAETGREQGLIQTEESELIKNIFEFNDQLLSNVCTPINEVDKLLMNENEETWIKKIIESHHTFYPIFESGGQKIIGILNTKDFFRLKDYSRDNVMNYAVNEVVFAEENMNANTIFNEMKIRKQYFIVVIDQLKNIKGIITLHDIIELIVGKLDEQEDLKH